MRRQPYLCPVHLFERMLCDGYCLAHRQDLRRLQSDYRQYWYDRRRGVGVMPAPRFEHVRQQPLWRAWRVA